MATLNKGYRVPATGDCKGYMYMNWERSPKVNGKIKLSPHPLTYYRNSQQVLRTLYCDTPPSGYSVLPRPKDAELLNATGPGAAAGAGYDTAFWAALQNKTYAKLYSRIKSDKAGLGVNLAQVGKSISMIKDRTSKIASMLSQKEATMWANRRIIRRRVGKPPSSWRDVMQARASDILEGEFGWAPLVSDAIATMAVLANGVPYSPWIRASRKEAIRVPFRWDSTDAYYNTGRGWVGEARCTYSVQVQVTNPNLWLLNQLGLINPATVALDAVPWSWVVSMFVNYNQVLNSFTDEVGIALSNISVTRSRDVTLDEKFVGHHWFYHPVQQDFRTTRLVEKHRTVGGVIPRPTLQVHWPKADWNLALIASSVMLQRVNKLNAKVAKLFGVQAPRY